MDCRDKDTEQRRAELKECARLIREFHADQWKEFLLIASSAVVLAVSKDPSTTATLLILCPFITYCICATLVRIGGYHCCKGYLSELEVDAHVDRNGDEKKLRMLDDGAKIHDAFFKWRTYGWGNRVFNVQEWVVTLGLPSIALAVFDIAFDSLLHKFIACLINCL